jgi:hypothetical protein
VRSLLFLLAGFSFVLSSCHSVPHQESASREPSAAAAPVEHDHKAPTDETNNAPFTDNETMNRHTFVIADMKGHFGYHFTQFNSAHQHQVFVKMKITRKGFSEKDVQALFAGKPSSKVSPYFSITTNPPRLTIRDIFTGKKKAFEGTIYDGLIATTGTNGDSTKLDQKAGLVIEKILYTHPMLPSEQKRIASTHILFGSYGADKPAKTDFSMAHLIQGGDSFEQVLRVTTSEPLQFEDYQMLSIDAPENQRLEVGKTYDATLVDGKQIKITVDHQFYQETRPSAG